VENCFRMEVRDMFRTFLIVGGACIVLMGFSACQPKTATLIKGKQTASVESTQKAGVYKEVIETHPDLDPDEKMQPCNACHVDVTPDLYEEWYNSRHGIAQVRCFQCHGNYDELVVKPGMQRCRVCHAQDIAGHSDNKACWSCHPAHAFVPVESTTGKGF